MANDIEINVRVANHSNAGLAATTQSMNRLKVAARDAGGQVTRLRAEMSRDLVLRAQLDNQTEASFAQLRSTIQELKAGGPIKIRARLNNETATQFTQLKATIGELKSAGTIRLKVNLADSSRVGLAAAKARLSELKAMTPVHLSVTFDGDAAQITAAARAMRDLRSDTSRVSTAMGALTPRAVAAAAALELVQHAASEASDELRGLRARAVGAAAALADLRASSTGLSSSLRSVSRSSESVDGRMEGLATRSETLRERMSELSSSFGRAGESMSGLRGNLGSVSSSADRASDSSNRLLQVALALAPALVPLAAAAVPVAASMGAAGAAALVFGAAIFGQFKAMGDASKAQDELTKTMGAHGQASSQAAKAESEYLNAVGQLPKATQEASAALELLTSAYQSWSAGLASDTMPVAMKGFAVLTGLFPKLTPLVQGASKQLDRFMSILAGGVQSPGFDRMMQRFAVFASESLAKGISGLVRFGQALESGGSARNGIASFMEFARTNGPAVGETLRNLGEAIRRVLVASAATGVGVLSVVNAFAKLLNSVPPEVLSRLVQLAVVFKAVQLASAGLALIAPRLIAASVAAAAFARNAVFVGVAASIREVAASMTLLQRSTVVLAVLAAAALAISELSARAKGAPPSVDGLTTSLKKLGEAGKFTGELKKTFGDMDGFVERVEVMQKKTEALDKMKGFASLAGVGAIIDRVVPKIDELVNGTKSLSAAQEDFKAFDESFSNLARSGYADEAARQFRGFEEALRSSGRTTEEIAALFPQYTNAVASIAAEQEIAARAMGVFGEQAVAVQAKLDMQKQSADGLRQSINALNEVYLQARGGVREMEAAIDAATESLKKNGHNLDENTEKGRANNQALDDLAAATMKAAEAALVNGQGWEAAQAIWERGRGKLLESAQAMGLTEAQARALADQILATPDKTAVLRGNMEDLQAKLASAKGQLASVPDSRRAEVRANIADLQAKVDQAQRELSGLRDRTVFVRTHYENFTSQHTGGQAQAHGGIVGAAGGGPRSRMTLVGEQGPELVDLAPGSRVRSNPDSKRIAAGMAGGGGGGPTVLEIRSSGSRIDDLLLEVLRGAIRVKGGDVQLVLGSRNR